MKMKYFVLLCLVVATNLVAYEVSFFVYRLRISFT